MPAPESTLDHYRGQQRLAALTMKATRRQWDRLGVEDFDDTWEIIGRRLVVLLTASQLRAATDGAAYVEAAVSELGLPASSTGVVAPSAFAGTASDGRPLESLLYLPVVRAREALGQKALLDEALATGRSLLDEIVRTQVADAARVASGVAITAHTGVTGWVRMLNPPSCTRCAVLAGKWFRWNQGFQRHPRCDCRHIPATESIAGDLTTDPRKAIEAGQVRGLSAADTKAIVDAGADVGQVINARRGMYTADYRGRQLAATREGTTARGAAGRRLGEYSRIPRLRPEEIYRQAGTDRAEAIRLLDRFGYLNT